MGKASGKTSMIDPKTAPEGLVTSCTLDVRGMTCPMPVLKAKRAIEKLNPGEVLVVLYTDPDHRDEILKWSVGKGHEYLGERQDGSDTLRCYVQKENW